MVINSVYVISQNSNCDRKAWRNEGFYATTVACMVFELRRWKFRVRMLALVCYSPTDLQKEESIGTNSEVCVYWNAVTRFGWNDTYGEGIMAETGTYFKNCDIQLIVEMASFHEYAHKV